MYTAAKYDIFDQMSSNEVTYYSLILAKLMIFSIAVNNALEYWHTSLAKKDYIYSQEKINDFIMLALTIVVMTQEIHKTFTDQEV